MATRTQRLKKAEADLQALHRAKQAQRKLSAQKRKVWQAKTKVSNAAGTEYQRANNKVGAISNLITKKTTQISNIKGGAARKRQAELARKGQDAKTKELNKTPWYKWIQPSGKPPIAGNSFKYSMPKGNTPGKWHTERRGVDLCNYGFHATKPSHVNMWKRDKCHLYVVEVAGIGRHSHDKSAFSKMRVMRQVTEAELNKLSLGQAV